MNQQSKRRAARMISAISLAVAGSGYAVGAAPTFADTAGAPTNSNTVQFIGGPTAGRVAVSGSEFRVTMPTSLSAGTYTFEFTNTGMTSHDLVISRASGEVARSPVIAGGATTEVTATLEPGTYEFWCSVPGHRMLGMTTTVTVN